MKLGPKKMSKKNVFKIVKKEAFGHFLSKFWSKNGPLVSTYCRILPVISKWIPRCPLTGGKILHVSHLFQELMQVHVENENRPKTDRKSRKNRATFTQKSGKKVSVHHLQNSEIVFETIRVRKAKWDLGFPCDFKLVLRG